MRQAARKAAEEQEIEIERIISEEAERRTEILVAEEITKLRKNMDGPQSNTVSRKETHLPIMNEVHAKN